MQLLMERHLDGGARLALFGTCLALANAVTQHRPTTVFWDMFPAAPPTLPSRRGDGEEQQPAPRLRLSRALVSLLTRLSPPNLQLEVRRMRKSRAQSRCALISLQCCCRGHAAVGRDGR